MWNTLIEQVCQVTEKQVQATVLFALPGAMMSVMMLNKMPTSYFQIH